MSWNTPNGGSSGGYSRSKSPYHYSGSGPYSGSGRRGPSGAAISAPGIALIIVAIVGLLVSIVFLGLSIFQLFNINQQIAEIGRGRNLTSYQQGRVVGLYTGHIVRTVFLAINMLMQFLILAGGVCMITKRNYQIAMTASIVSLIPICSPVCVLGIPFGIWALVMLSNKNVKKSFR